MTIEPILVAGAWTSSNASGSFQSYNPKSKEKLSDCFPVSTWQDCEVALDSAAAAAKVMAGLSAENIAQFLEAYALGIESRKEELVETAHLETALPKSPRLADGELPRTLGQIRQAAQAARDYSWVDATIDTTNNIRSQLGSLGPVCVFGPNNFPFAFGGISGGDFVSAIAAGNPVIAIAHYLHPKTTQIFAEEAQTAADATGMPKGTVQLLYKLEPEDGLRLVADNRLRATGFTGSRAAGLRLKNAAEAAGNLIYLEMSSVNPVVVLPGALKQRGAEVLQEYLGSVLMGAGQFCTNPGLLLLIDDEESQIFIKGAVEGFEKAPIGTLLSEGVETGLKAGIKDLRDAGAELLAGDSGGRGSGYCHANTLLRISGTEYLSNSQVFQAEAFGNSSLIVLAKDVNECENILASLEGNLTGCFYSDTKGSDDTAYRQLEPTLRNRVGRLLNDKMPTGVAVSSAMNHGGPFPATGHAGFSAVGFPASIKRFAMLHCFDTVRESRLPAALGNKNPTGKLMRVIDGEYAITDI